MKIVINSVGVPDKYPYGEAIGQISLSDARGCKNSRLPLVAIICFISLIVGLSLLVLTVMGFTFRALLLEAIVLCLLTPLTWKRLSRRLDIFEPLVIADIALGVMFVGRPLADLITGHTDHIGYSVLPTFNETLAIALIGILSFQLGYLSPLKTAWVQRFRPPLFHPNRATVAAWLYLLFGGLLFSLFLAGQGGFGVLLYLLAGRQESNNFVFLASTGYLYNGILMLGAASLIFFALATVAHRRLCWIWFSITGACLLTYYGARGGRSDLLPLVMAIPTFWYLSKHSRPHARTVVLAALVGISLIGWMRQIRTAGQRGEVITELSNSLSAPWAQAGKLISGDDNDMFDSLANELQIVPETLPFQHGATVTDIIIRAIPRMLWPSKPLDSNDVVVSNLWPQHYALSRASPAFSLIGAFYADSGVITVSIGMFIIGMLFRIVWRWFRRNKSSTVAQLIYSMVLPFTVILMRGTIPDTLSRMLFYFVPVVMLMVTLRLGAGIANWEHI